MPVRPRVEVPFIVQSANPGDGTLLAVNGATATVTNRDGTAASVYSSETTDNALATNVLTTTSTGRIDGWVNEGRYTITVSGAGITTYSQPWDARSGGVVSKFGNLLVGEIGPSAQYGIGFDDDLADAATVPDALLYRSANAVLRTNSSLIIDAEARVNQARLIGSPTNLAIQDSTGANLFRINYLSGFTDNANGQRVELGNNTVATNDAVVGGLGGVALRRLGLASQGITIGNAAVGSLPVPTTDSLRVEYAGGATTLQLTSTGANTGITIGGDVELSRSAANVLRIPDTVNANALQISGTALASAHLSDTANIGLLTGAQTFTGAKTFTGGLLSQAAAGSFPVTTQTTGDTVPRLAVKADGTIEFGTGALARDVTLYRDAGTLRTGNALRAGIVTASYGSTNEAAIGNLGPTSAAAIVLNDTSLYRLSAANLRTAASLTVDTNLILGGATTQQGRITLPTGTTVADGISFGHSATAGSDRVDLYRSAAGVVTLTGNINVTGNLTVSGTSTTSTTQSSSGAFTAVGGSSGQIKIGTPGISALATVYFGSAEDTTLYRLEANSLRTPGSLTVDGILTASGIINITGVSTNKNTSNTAVAEVFQVNNINRGQTLGDGTHQWADATGAFDTTLARSAPGVLSVTNTLNVTTGLQIAGTALASTHLTDVATIARLASPSFTGTVTIPTLAVSVQAQVIAGAVGTPSYSFAGDTNTGLYSPGADTLALSTAGVERFNISATGATTIPGTLTVGGLAVVVTNDARLTDSRIPTGTAAGHLTGTYPAPSIATGVVANTHISATAAIVDTKLATISTAGKVADTAIPSTIARLANPVFTAPQAAASPTANDSTLLLATTAWVLGQAGTTNPLVNGAVSQGTETRWSRADHVHPIDTTRAPLASPTFTGTVNAGAFISTATTIGFYGVPNVTRREGRGAFSYASGAVTYDAAVRTLSIGTSTLNTTQQVLANLIGDLQATGLI